MTELTDFQKQLSQLLPEAALAFDEPMAKHTTFRIGGPAEAMAFPKTREELQQILKVSALLDCKPAILGAGSNVLAPDEGRKGLVICLKDCLCAMEQLPGHRIRCQAGVTMARAALFAAGCGLSGLEFAHGIPGTIGGGIYMNAGAYGSDMSTVCQEVEVMDLEGQVRKLSREEMAFSYRHSRLEEEQGIVVSAVFSLTPGQPEAIRARIRELMEKRRASQPLNLPSAGSAFKRPQGGYAAALIDGAGLRGFQVGNAAIAQKHAGFAVNLGGATAEEVKALLRQVSDIVYRQTGIRLEPEIRIW